MPGAFKLDHLHPVKPILFSKFYNFFTFILEANSYYLRTPIMRKGNSPNSRNGLDRGVSVPEAFKLGHLHPVKPILLSKFYNFFTFILEANSYYPRGPIMRNGSSPNFKTELSDRCRDKSRIPPNSAEMRVEASYTLITLPPV